MKQWKNHVSFALFVSVLALALIGCSSNQKSTDDKLKEKISQSDLNESQRQEEKNDNETNKELSETSATETNASLKESFVAEHTDEFTFYVNPEWSKQSDGYIFETANGNEFYGITGISNLGSKSSEDFFKSMIEYLNEKGDIEITKTSESLIKKKTANGVTYQVGWIDSTVQGKPHYTAMVMAPQKNVAISFFARLEDDFTSKEQAYKTLEIRNKLNAVFLTFELGDIS